MLAVLVTAFVMGASLAEAQKFNASSPLPKMIVPTIRSGDRKMRLAIPAIVNYGGPVFPLGPMCSVGMQVAVDTIHKSSMLENYELVVEPLDDLCSRPQAITIALDLYNGKAFGYNSTSRLPLMIGPMCASHTYTGIIAKFHNHVAITGNSIVKEVFTERSLYNSFFSIAPSFEIFYKAIPAFLKSNEWSKVYLLSETVSFWTPLEEILLFNMAKQNISLGGVAKIGAVSGVPAASEHIEQAVRELKAFDPRIIILNTNNAPQVACWLYKYQLYGPSYVILILTGSYFLPNYQPRYADCSEKMLFEVLKSIIIFTLGGPTNSQDSSSKDSLGLTVSEFENILKEKVINPELSPLWFWWRFFCYEPVVASALALDLVERELQTKYNDTLANWATSGSKFEQNGAFIHQMLRKTFTELTYRGLTSGNVEGPLNARSGVTAFHQMQTVPNFEEGKMSFVAAIRAVQVAAVDSTVQKLVLGPGNYVWRTSNRLPPRDSLRIVLQEMTTVNSYANYTILGIGLLFLMFSLILLAINIIKGNRSDEISQTMPNMNSLVLLGNSLSLSSIFTIPFGTSEIVIFQCSATTFLQIVGFSMIYGSIFAKMEVALLLTFKKNGSRAGMIGKNHAGSGSIHKITPTPNHVKILVPRGDKRSRNSNRKSSSISDIRNGEPFIFYCKRALALVIVWALYNALLCIVLFSIEPFVPKTFYRLFETSATDPSLAYQHYFVGCSLNVKSPSASAIFVILLGGFGIVLLRSMFLSFMLRDHRILLIKDIGFVRVASYCISMIIVVGGAVIWLFLKDIPELWAMALSVLSIIIVSVDIILIFIPKLKTGNYL